MKNNKLIVFYLILPVFIIDLSGQVPVVKNPQSASPFNIPLPNTNPASNVPSLPHSNNRNRQQSGMYERDRLETQRRNTQMQQFNEDLDFFSNRGIQYELPTWSGTQGTEYFYQTAKKLLDMLNGKIPLNLKEAVFSVENAYFEGQLDRTKYEKAILNLVTIAQAKAKQDGYNWNNPTTQNIMLFRVMSDTLKVKLPLQESATVSYPMQYDFDDYGGEQNWSKMFVNKLLASRSGQCHSLPLLYLILCEDVGAEAYLAFSPSHSYIKFRDKADNWYNLELTQGKITTDAFIAGSGFITAEAIKNKIFMEPQSKRETIAQCLSDLAMGYMHKYGYDDFAGQCADSVLKYAPNNISALMLKANYQTIRFQHVISQTGTPPLDTLKTRFPKAYEFLNEVKATYKKIDDSGFREMPKEAYETWLQSVNEEREKREHEEKYHKVLQIIR